MSDWLLDLGNSRLKLAVLAADAAHGPVRAVAHAAIKRVVAEDASVGPGDTAWLASVAPAAVLDPLVAILQARGLRVERVTTRAREGRLQIAYPDPHTLGVDRFLALLAASVRDDGPWVVVSAGTALTADVLATDGRHLGGVIAAMPADMRAALARRVPALDVPGGDVRALGTDTADAIASGAAHAACGLVERIARVAKLQCGAEPMVLVAGGGAQALRALDVPRLQSAPTLVLAGLAAYARARSD